MIGDIIYIIVALWLLRFAWDNVILIPINYIRILMGKSELPRIKPIKTKK